MPHIAFRSFVLDPQEPLPEGSCVFMENTLPRPLDGILERVTGSPLSHVAILLNDASGPMVYEAFPPVARKLSWDYYVLSMLPKWAGKRWTRRLGGLNQFWWISSRTFAGSDLSLMRSKAEGMLGMKYSLIWNYLFNAENLTHCSEFVADIFEAAGYFASAKGRETPGSLFKKLLRLEEG